MDHTHNAPSPPCDEECIFCKIVAGTIPSYKVVETYHCIAFLDAFPVCKGHTLVIPKAHYATLDLLPDDEMMHLSKVLRQTASAVSKLDGVKGYNVVQNNGVGAGQLVQHAHFHIIPRFENDKLLEFPPSGAMISSEDGNGLKDMIVGLME